VEKPALRSWPDEAASAGICRTPVKHRFGNEAARPPETKPRRRRLDLLRAGFSDFGVTVLKVAPIRPRRTGGVDARRSLLISNS
jgi:hypothetical protein